MLKSEGTVFRVGKSTLAIRIPVDVARDSQFPFKVNEKVVVQIAEDTLVVSHK